MISAQLVTIVLLPIGEIRSPDHEVTKNVNVLRLSESLNDSPEDSCNLGYSDRDSEV